MTTHLTILPTPTIPCSTLFRVDMILWTEATRWVFARSRSDAIEAAEDEFARIGRRNFKIAGEGIDRSEVTHALQIGGCA